MQYHANRNHAARPRRCFARCLRPHPCGREQVRRGRARHPAPRVSLDLSRQRRSDRSTGRKKSWYRIVSENAPAIQRAGFTWVWFPPCCDSLDAHGYLPRKWNVLDNAYGTEAELRRAIEALGPVRAMADVVVSHRVGVATGGADFAEPAFPDNRAAVSRDDDSGAGTGNYSTGERYSGARHLDHTNPDVRAAIKQYLGRLKALGFGGWRYDQVKGYAGHFVREFNQATAPGLSVGEFYDGDRQKVTHWIDSTGGKSAAFDFPTRYILYDACARDDYHRLRSRNGDRIGPSGLIGMWPSRSVTFLDNHDTESRRDEEHQRHYNDTRHYAGHTVAMGYAYLFTHPGIPCVFWPHLFDWGGVTRERIEKLIQLRKDAGIHSHSAVDIKETRKGLYAAIIDGKAAVKLGSLDWSPGWGWHLAVWGERFAAWVRG